MGWLNEKGLRKMGPNKTLRIAITKDVPEMAFVHLRSFKGFFLTFLGKNFLSELYIACLMDESGIGFVCEQDNSICGFVVGTSQPAGFYNRLLHQRWWRFALASLIPILKNPLIIPRLLRAFQKPQDVSNLMDTGTLMSVAVAPEAQGCGLGQVLVEAFLEEAARRGLKHVDLLTDKNNNDSVNLFYQRMGFRISRTFVTLEDREMNEYLIDICSPRRTSRLVVIQPNP